MESKRQQKFASLLQQDLAAVFQRDLPHLFPGLPPGISTVRVSPDLGVARVYLSLLLVKDSEAMLRDIRDNGKAIRQALAKRIRKQVRVIPELNFFLDDSASYAARMDEVINTLHIPPAPAPDEETDTPSENKRPKLFADEDE